MSFYNCFFFTEYCAQLLHSIAQRQKKGTVFQENVLSFFCVTIPT